MHLYHVITLTISLWQANLSHATPVIHRRDATCSAAEVSKLKCLSPSQYYICPAPGQAPIIQAVAAGTQCQNNAVLSVAVGGSPPPAHPPPATAPNPAPPPPPNSPPPKLVTPSGPNSPCRHGGQVTQGTVNCSKLSGGAGLILTKHVYCLDHFRYTICGAAVETIVCLLKDTMNRCWDGQVWDDHGLKVPESGDQTGRGPH